MPKLDDEIRATVLACSELLRNELTARWEAWPLDLTETEKYEVVGGLMARQVTLATRMALSPSIWNGHLAPLVLRAMVEVFITFAWILQDPLERSRGFIRHGLGQEKLYLEHLKSEIDSDDEESDFQEMLDSIESWINSQRFTFLTDVNVGSWSGISLRDMAAEIGEYDLYRFAFQPFSASGHSMWNHIAKYNLRYCQDPLHRHHRIPSEVDSSPHPDYLVRAAKYAAMTFQQFDSVFGFEVAGESARAYLESELSRIGQGHFDD